MRDVEWHAWDACGRVCQAELGRVLICDAPRFRHEPNNPNLTNQSGVQAARQFDPPVYKENRAGGYIEFRAYDPERGKMRRKTMKINRVKGVTNYSQK